MARIDADSAGRILHCLLAEWEEERYPELHPDATEQLAFDASTNAATVAALGQSTDAWRLSGGVLTRDGQTVAINPPGPETVQKQEAADYQGQLDAAVTFLEGAITTWPTLTANQKQAWVATNMDKVLKVDLGLVRMVRWAARRLGLGA